MKSEQKILNKLKKTLLTVIFFLILRYKVHGQTNIHCVFSIIYKFLQKFILKLRYMLIKHSNIFIYLLLVL